MFKIFRTAKFDKEFAKQLSLSEQKQIMRIELNQLTINPFVGDPLGFPFFREKKVGGKRVYFLIYEDLNAVLMIAISDKKTQQETIDRIKEHLQSYYHLIREVIKQHA